ncbi:MAG: MMPL family transporter [Planctomycetia bacterium]|nr:MMPL family transporter [Planctomycetia bacterium]
MTEKEQTTEEQNAPNLESNAIPEMNVAWKKRTRRSRNRQNNARSDQNLGKLPWGARPAYECAKFAARNAGAILSFAIILAFIALFFCVCYFPEKTIQTPKVRGEVAILCRDARIKEFGDVQEIFLTAKSQDPQALCDAMTSACQRVENELEDLAIQQDALDRESLADKRLFLFNTNELAQALALSQQARRYQDGDPQPATCQAVLLKLIEPLQTRDANDNLTENLLDLNAYLMALRVAVTPETADVNALPNPARAGVEQTLPDALTNAQFSISEDQTEATLTLSAEQNSLDVALEELNDLVQQLKRAYPDVDFYLTGTPIFTKEQTELAQRVIAIIIPTAAILLLCVSWLVLGSFRRACATLLSALLLMALTAGALTALRIPLTLELLPRLAILAAFALTALSQVVAQYSATRQVERSASEALVESAKSYGARLTQIALTLPLCAIFCPPCDLRHDLWRAIGPWIITALALWLTAACVMPAILRLFESGKPFPDQRRCVDLCDALHPLIRRAPKLTTIVTLLVVVALVPCLQRLDIATTLNRYVRRDSQASRGAQILLRVAQRDILCAETLSESYEELRVKRSKILEDKTLSAFAPCELLPNVSANQLVQIEMIGDNLATLQPQIPAIPIPPAKAILQTIATLRNAVDQCVQNDQEEPNGELLQELRANLDDVETKIQTLPEPEYNLRIDAIQRIYAVETLKRLYQLKTIANVETPTTDDLSDTLSRRADAHCALYPLWVYSNQSLDSYVQLKAFTTNLREIAPNALGNAIETYDTARYDAFAILIAVLATLAYTVFAVSYALRGIATRGLILLAALCAGNLTFATMSALGLPLDTITSVVGVITVALAALDAMVLAQNYQDVAGRTFKLTRGPALAISLSILASLACACALLPCPSLGFNDAARIAIIATIARGVATCVIIPSILNWLAQRD